MIHLLLALNFGVLILETRGFYEKLNRRKDKGRDAETSQPPSYATYNQPKHNVRLQ